MSLRRNQRQIAVGGHLARALQCDVVQRPKPFESRETPFYGLSLSVQGLHSGRWVGLLATRRLCLGLGMMTGLALYWRLIRLMSFLLEYQASPGPFGCVARNVPRQAQSLPRVNRRDRLVEPQRNPAGDVAHRGEVSLC